MSTFDWLHPSTLLFRYAYMRYTDTIVMNFPRRHSFAFYFIPHYIAFTNSAKRKLINFPKKKPTIFRSHFHRFSFNFFASSIYFRSDCILYVKDDHFEWRRMVYWRHYHRMVVFRIGVKTTPCVIGAVTSRPPWRQLSTFNFPA